MKAPEFPPGYVAQVPTVGYAVRSRSVEGAWWMVSGKECSCPAGQHGNTVCFHRTQVARFARELSEKYKRPRAQDTGEEVVGRFCD